ncbi:copper chaperone PCu(A)C [Lacibacterium aquatile]|uniref:Copper chaperone PCu(A)C n=1 Tax=Lacibacterium aquatile TaxID=1168082 RepID=A0ABW5DYP5_9PROT
MRRFGLSLLFTAALTLPAYADGVRIEAPWARATIAAQKTGGAYIALTNNSSSPDRLIAAETPVAERAEIHEHRHVDGVMQMREVAGGVTLPPGQTVTFGPGGYHIMLMGLKQPLAKGAKFPLTLVFEKSGKQTVDVTVEAAGARGPSTP